MYEKLKDVTLKSGEPAEIGIVHAPDVDFGDPLNALLAHKGDPWVWQNERTLREPADELVSRYYICRLAGEPISNIMTAEYARTGTFGHVFTNPDHRRKGACNLILTELMRDFDARDGGLMLLGTGFASTAYWIYYRHGFRSLSAGSGMMRYAASGDFEAEHFRPGDAHVVDLQWRDWPRLGALYASPGGERIRNVAQGLAGRSLYEGGFLELKRHLEEDDGYQAKVLETEHGAAAGLATIHRDPRWGPQAYLLDAFIHENFRSHGPPLLRSLALPAGWIRAYTDAASADKAQWLEALGFTKEADLAADPHAGAQHDVVVYSHEHGEH